MRNHENSKNWIPASAGMTTRRVHREEGGLSVGWIRHGLDKVRDISPLKTTATNRPGKTMGNSGTSRVYGPHASEKFLTGFTPLKTKVRNGIDMPQIIPVSHKENQVQVSNKFLTGFTLIELMVVVVIIGILAAIAIPNYIAMKNRANQASVEAAIHTIQLTLENYAVDTGGIYPSTPDLSDQNFVDLLPNKQMPQNPYTFVAIQPTSASGYEPDPSSWALTNSGCTGVSTQGQITYYFSPSTYPSAWAMNGCNNSGAITANPTYDYFVVHN